MMYVTGFNHTNTSATTVKRLMKKIADYPSWERTKKWIREVRKEVLEATPEDRTSFGATTRVLEEIAERYGHHQDEECMDLKDNMLKIETAGTGRIPLETFYAAADSGTW